MSDKEKDDAIKEHVKKQLRKITPKPAPKDGRRSAEQQEMVRRIRASQTMRQGSRPVSLPTFSWDGNCTRKESS